jgi:hypothetical protein
MFLACTFLSALNKLYIIQNLKPEKSTSMFINYLVNSCGGTQKSTCQELALTRTASEWFWWKESSTTKEREICLWFCGNYKIMFENGGLETPKDMRLISSFITGPLSCGLLCNDVKHYDHLKYIYVFFDLLGVSGSAYAHHDYSPRPTGHPASPGAGKAPRGWQTCT